MEKNSYCFLMNYNLLKIKESHMNRILIICLSFCIITHHSLGYSYLDLIWKGDRPQSPKEITVKDAKNDIKFFNICT